MKSTYKDTACYKDPEISKALDKCADDTLKNIEVMDFGNSQINLMTDEELQSLCSTMWKLFDCAQNVFTKCKPDDLPDVNLLMENDQDFIERSSCRNFKRNPPKAHGNNNGKSNSESNFYYSLIFLLLTFVFNRLLMN